MAVYPCDATKHRYPQPQQSAYVSHVAGADVSTYRLRLCPSHFRVVQVAAQEHLTLVDDLSESTEQCTVCGEPKTDIIFARLFPSKQEEQTYAADLCGQHAEAATKALLVSTQRPLPARY